MKPEDFVNKHLEVRFEYERENLLLEAKRLVLNIINEALVAENHAELSERDQLIVKMVLLQIVFRGDPWPE